MALGKSFWYQRSNPSLVLLHDHVRGATDHLENVTPLLRDVGDGIWNPYILGRLGPAARSECGGPLLRALHAGRRDCSRHLYATSRATGAGTSAADFGPPLSGGFGVDP